MSAELFLTSVLASVALHPEQCLVSSSTDDRGILLRIKAHKQDMPRLIGKEGRNIAALRLVMKLYAKDGPNISLILDEPTQA